MGNFAQATTGSNGLRLLAGFDTSGMRAAETGRRIDVWEIKTSKRGVHYWKTVKGKKTKMTNPNPKLGDLTNTRFQILANHAIRDGVLLTESVALEVGSRVIRLTVCGKTYLLSGGRVYKRQGALT